MSHTCNRAQGVCISFLIITCLLLLLVYTCYNVLLVDLIFDLCLLLGLNSKHNQYGFIALGNAELVV